MNPEEIEQLSFQIIDREAGPHAFSSRQWQVVRRMIHTTADFEFMCTVKFHPHAIEAGLRAVRAGRPVVTDTRMAKVGLRKKEMDAFGVEPVCLITDAAVAETAKKSGITRAQAAVDVSVDNMPQAVYVVGNAPTALMRLLEHIRNQRARPALVVGLPVGFVNAAESKEALAAVDVPYITNTGRKGGSSLAAAVVNALLIMATDES